MAQVVWTTRALSHLRAITEYSAEHFSPTRAEKMAARLYGAADLLGRSPLLGPVVPEFGRDHLREWYVKPYRVLYQVRADVCYIVSVIHGSRNLARVTDPDDLESLAPPD
jgi:plasmid stabilization system protein ParE